MLTNKQSLRVCVYNYKGGAAKTTIIVNTAAALAHPEHGNQKVLLIDLDPQCNSTQFYHDDNETLGGARTLGKNETEPTSACAAAEALTHALPSGGTEPELISDALHPTCDAAAMDALVSNQDMSPLYRIMHALFVDNEASEVRRLIETERWKLLSQVNVDELTRQSEFGDNFWVLEGDSKISEFEANIVHAISNFGQKGLLKHYGLVSYLMEVLTEVLGFDVIMIDCSPSNSALNKAAALACDYILPPCMASLYSAGSIKGLLSSVLPGDDGWLGLHEKITHRWREEGGEPKAEIAGLKEWLLPATAPVLLPILVSNYPMGPKCDSMKCEPILGKKRRKGRGQPPSALSAQQPSTDSRVVKLMHSQFVYSIMNYVNQECRTVSLATREAALTASSARARPRARELRPPRHQLRREHTDLDAGVRASRPALCRTANRRLSLLHVWRAEDRRHARGCGEGGRGVGFEAEGLAGRHDQLRPGRQ